MTAEDAALLQEKILSLCHAAGRFGLTEERISRALILHGYGADKATLDRNLKFLESEGLLEFEEDTLRADLRRWKTTAKGDRHLMRAGLI